MFDFIIVKKCLNNYNEEQKELENMNYLRINYQWFFHFERKKRKREIYRKTTCCHSEFDLLKIILFTKKNKHKHNFTEYDDDMDEKKWKSFTLPNIK